MLLLAARFFAAAGFFALAEEARTFLTIAALAAPITAAPTTAAAIWAVRDCEIERRALAALAEREEVEAFDFIGGMVFAAIVTLHGGMFRSLRDL